MLGDVLVRLGHRADEPLHRVGVLGGVGTRREVRSRRGAGGTEDLRVVSDHPDLALVDGRSEVRLDDLARVDAVRLERSDRFGERNADEANGVGVDAGRVERPLRLALRLAVEDVDAVRLAREVLERADRAVGRDRDPFELRA